MPVLMERGRQAFGHRHVSQRPSLRRGAINRLRGLDEALILIEVVKRCFGLTDLHQFDRAWHPVEHVPPS
jgi:hypothetical protein